MNLLCNSGSECRVRVDAALAVLELSTARMKNLIAGGGSDEAVESACTLLRLSTSRLLAAMAECREISREDQRFASPVSFAGCR